MTKSEGNAAIERILRLAAYFKLRRGHLITLADICENVPGYEAHFDLEGNIVKDAMWEAVRKRIRRDLAQLADVFGIRIEYDDKTQMYQLLPPFLTSEERDVLVAAAALVRVDGLNDEQLTALGAAVDADGQRIIVRVHRHLLALRAALAARTPVRFRYRGTERLFEPWAVGLWRDRWYTVGFDRRAGAQRTFRLDRFDGDGDESAIELRPDAGRYEIPPGFVADDTLVLDPNSWGHDPPLVARVRVDADWREEFVRQTGATMSPARRRHVRSGAHRAPLRSVSRPRARVRHPRGRRGTAGTRRPDARVARRDDVVNAMRTNADRLQVLARVLALADERRSISLMDAADEVGVSTRALRELLEPVLFLEWRDADGNLHSEARAFLLTEDDELVVTEEHWLRGLASTQPDASTAMRLFVAGVVLQAATSSSPLPALDHALERLEGVLDAEVVVHVDRPRWTDLCERARGEKRTMQHALRQRDRRRAPQPRVRAAPDRVEVGQLVRVGSQRWERPTSSPSASTASCGPSSARVPSSRKACRCPIGGTCRSTNAN